MAIAPATPAILPVPTVPASAVQTAWNGVIAPSAASFLWNMRPMVVLSAKGNLRICKKPVRTLSSSPTPIMQTIAGTPQTKSLTTLLMAAIVSKNMGESILSEAENTLFYQIAGRDARAGECGMCGKTAKMQGKMAKTVRSSTCCGKRFFPQRKEPSAETEGSWKQPNYAFFCASSTATATATVAPTIGLLPMPIRPIISTCAGTEEEPANCASECIRPMVSVMP